MDRPAVQCRTLAARGGVDRAGEDIPSDGVLNPRRIEWRAGGERRHCEAYRTDAAPEVVAAVAGIQHQRPLWRRADGERAGLLPEDRKCAQPLPRDPPGDLLRPRLERAS